MTKHDGVQVDSILIDQAKCGQALRQVRASYFDLPVALGLQRADRALEIVLNKPGVGADRLQRARDDPFRLVPPRRREGVFLCIPFRMIVVIRLREVMAEPVSAQDRLDKIVVLIAANMVAEVCSVYVLRVDGTLELYATEGLNREAVHQTVLRADEGLVGLVASEANAINLSDAQAHPAFSYRPETGEEIYHSFLGVPVLRAGNTLGVLVVQNRARRTYSEEEVEALQTTAMVLAEMIASGELSALARPGAEPAARRTLHLSGTALNDGIALGHVVLHEPRVVITNFIADDPHKERQRLEAAVTDAARRPRHHARAWRRRRRRRAPRRARSLPHVRP